MNEFEKTKNKHVELMMKRSKEQNRKERLAHLTNEIYRECRSARKDVKDNRINHGDALDAAFGLVADLAMLIKNIVEGDDHIVE